MKPIRRRSFLRAVGGPALLAGVVVEKGPAGPTAQDAVPGPGKGACVIVSEGRSTYTIVLGRSASTSEHHAALELRSFLLEMTGCRLPVVTEDAKVIGNRVFVGDSDGVREAGVDLDALRLGDEGFVIRTVGPHLVLAGGRRRGTLYAVYAFLETLGVRWFAPGETLMPRLKTVTIAATAIVERPGLPYRELSHTHTKDGDWSARNRLNGHHHDLDPTRGGKIAFMTPYVHTFDDLVPPAQYFEAHPEYYSIINGKRRYERGQLCLSHPEVVKIVTEKVLEWIAGNPDATIFSVSQNDVSAWCECEHCLAVDQAEDAHSGSVIHFVNKVADVVGRKHPGKFIETLAYTHTEAPPRQVRPRANVIVRLCHMQGCDTHPLASCERNRRFVEHLKGWTSICENVYVWHYVVNFSHYLLPFPNLDAFRHDIKFYRDAGAKGIYCQASEREKIWTDLAELKAFLLARLLWNPNADVDAVIDGFLDDYYGKAAPPIREYIDLLHAKVRSENIHANLYTDPVDAAYLTTEVLERAEKLFDQAERVTDDPIMLKRVQKGRLSVDYACLALPLRFVLNGPTIQAENGPQLLPLLERFEATAKGEGIGYYRYDRPDHIGTLDSFAANTRMLLEPHPIAAVRELSKAVDETMASIKKWISENKDAGGAITFLAVQQYVQSRGLLGREVINWLRQDGFLIRREGLGDRFLVNERPIDD